MITAVLLLFIISVVDFVHVVVFVVDYFCCCSYCYVD